MGDDVWKDFSEKLRSGDIGKDKNGNLLFEVGDIASRAAWWERYKMHLLVAVNLGMMWCLQRVKRTEREARRIATEKEDEPGPQIAELDEDPPADKDKDT